MNNITVAATNHFELQEAKEKLVSFVTEKRRDCENKMQEYSAIIVSQGKDGVGTAEAKKQMSALKRKCIYYNKIEAALKRGYTPMPDMRFAGQTIAVRTDQLKPPSGTASYSHSNDLEVRAKSLPEGEGRYVSPQTMVQSYKDGDKTIWEAVELIEKISLPVAAVKHMLVNALNSAMGLKLFDEICVIGGRGSDPMLVGIIKGTGYKRINFLIGWWFDSRDL